eukprot:SAG31_NODE_22613_length_522_cov_0.543735_1_plen_51_part_10
MQQGTHGAAYGRTIMCMRSMSIILILICMATTDRPRGVHGHRGVLTDIPNM